MNIVLTNSLLIAVAAASKGGIKCSLQQVTDAREGIVAFTYFVPTGWKPDNSFKWTGNTYFAEYSASTPDRQYQVTHLEPLNINYSSSTGTAATGIRIEKATDFLQAVMHQMEQAGNASNVTVLDEINNDLPLTETQNLLAGSRMIGGMSQHQFRQAGYLKVKFIRNGVEEVASLGTTVAGSTMGNDMAVGTSRFKSMQGSYVAGPTVLVVNPTKPAPSKMKEAQIVASSARMTPKFLSYCMRLVLAISSAQLHATEEQGKRLREQMAEQAAKRMDDFKAGMALRDAQTHDFCNYLLDRQDYKAQDGSIVTIPTTYDHPWENGQGQFVLTDDPTFDPHGLGPGDWKPMSKSRAGE